MSYKSRVFDEFHGDSLSAPPSLDETNKHENKAREFVDIFTTRLASVSVELTSTIAVMTHHLYGMLPVLSEKNYSPAVSRRFLQLRKND